MKFWPISKPIALLFCQNSTHADLANFSSLEPYFFAKIQPMKFWLIFQAYSPTFCQNSTHEVLANFSSL